MPTLPLLRQEAYCQARAKGILPQPAAESPECGYDRRYGYKLDAKPKIQKRIIEITTKQSWSGARDVAPVVEQMVIAAQASAALCTAAGWKAAADGARYACLSRPLTARPAVPAVNPSDRWERVWGRAPRAIEGWKTL